MRAARADSTIVYDGSQLRSHWIFENLRIQGDAIVWFLGASAVPNEALVDRVDQREGDYIRAADMLHFLAEHFDPDLPRTVLRQRLLVAIAAEVIGTACGVPVERHDDDLFARGRKLSVSIATISPVSGLIHLGVNIDPVGAPVPAVGLQELIVAPETVGEVIATRYADEMQSVCLACTKVRWVR
jgi:hypothetical protein